jgi:ribosomal subunit interface protein
MTSKTAPQASSLTVQVAGRHVTVGEALRTRISDELVSRVGKYFERGGSAEATVGREGHDFCVDVSVHLNTGQQLVARGHGGDAHSAFDTALTRIETRIRRYKRRLVNHHNGGSRAEAEMASLVVLRAPNDESASDEASFDQDWDDVDGGAQAPAAMIIAEAEAAVKTQTVSMAVMELDLGGAPVVMFRNAAHGGLSVVYRRGDGNIGWIDPERAPNPKAPKTASVEHARM